jgi:hypothetical protein
LLPIVRGNFVLAPKRKLYGAHPLDGVCGAHMEVEEALM